MHRFFISPQDCRPGLVRLSDEDLAHIRAIRLRPGETFIVCDGAGTDYICRLGPSRGEPEIVDSRPSRGEPDVECRIFLALSKGDRMDAAVQKSVELGAASIVLFPSERSLPADASKKTARLQRIALEAAKQSGRGRIPEVTAAPSFLAAVGEAAKTQLPLFFYELEQSFRLRQALEEREDAKTISIFTGPEGGFTPDEAQSAQAAGMFSVTLGTRILRCETAPVAALAAIMYHTGNL